MKVFLEERREWRGIEEREPREKREIETLKKGGREREREREIQIVLFHELWVFFSSFLIN